jgi:hypothetical protein
MKDSRETERLVSAYLDTLSVPDGAKVDEKVLTDALASMQKTIRQQAAHTSRLTWRTIMTSRASKLAAAVVVIAVVLSFTVFDIFTKPAWALEQAIEALNGLRAVHMTGAFPGSTAEIWMRCNPAQTQSTDVMIQWSYGATTWVKDGSTYHYEAGQNKVYVEPAVTAGTSPWLGPELLELLGKADGAQVLRGKDPATGRDCITLVSSIWDVQGPKTFVIEFDAQTKLPVSFKQWPNLDRSGPPAFEAFKITYHKELPDRLFEARIPGNANHAEKPLTIPDENVGVLSDPDDGISTESLSQQEACEQVLRATYQAVIDGDLPQLKRLCPLCRNRGDDFLRSFVLRAGKNDQVVEIVKIGQIFKTGQTKLGPIVAVPAIVRCKDGTKVEEKMIVQFRAIAGKSSCVVHGPYGLPREIE